LKIFSLTIEKGPSAPMRYFEKKISPPLVSTFQRLFSNSTLTTFFLSLISAWHSPAKNFSKSSRFKTKPTFFLPIFIIFPEGEIN